MSLRNQQLCTYKMTMRDPAFTQADTHRASASLLMGTVHEDVRRGDFSGVSEEPGLRQTQKTVQRERERSTRTTPEADEQHTYAPKGICFGEKYGIFFQASPLVSPNSLTSLFLVQKAGKRRWACGGGKICGVQSLCRQILKERWLQ
mmetsp:Transcript_9385/g.21927  ORF Transcript_9385/g.21927 Transcript_9385/m.21927 type:complete len:147 (-) Transcript_9385:50-490(-)